LRYYIGVPLVLFLALVQTASLPLFSLFGAHPNLVLILLVSWLTVRGETEAMVLIPIAALALGLLDSHPLGIHLLALAPLALLSAGRQVGFIQADFLLALALAFTATLAYEGIFLVTLRLTGESLSWWGNLGQVVVPAAIANTLLTLPVYWLVWLGSVDRHRREAL
jgi:rod shape-determining protein MreD